MSSILFQQTDFVKAQIKFYDTFKSMKIKMILYIHNLAPIPVPL